MPYLRLLDLKTGTHAEFNVAVVRMGRHPGLEFSVSGEGANVVSGQHAWFYFRDDRWWLEDRGSRNGTFVAGRQLIAGTPVPVQPGTVVSLAQSGPQVRVEMASRHAMGVPVAGDGPTAEGSHGDDLADTPREGSSQPELPVLHLVLEDLRSGRRFEVNGSRIRIGRGPNCEVRPPGVDQTLISRTHAEIYARANGEVWVRDAHSVNGTFLNGRWVEREQRIKKRDQIAIGEDGPVLWVERVSVSMPGDPAPGWRKWLDWILPGRQESLPS